ncbi:YHS domain-containing (seleno)protein [Stappia indica]|uniref:YHS domain-containing (seleno)protein n=1 Tax=Stappia indica TaxID=538381 RepID=UPI001CD6DF55|nr:YHS domain-containing (seleno)protein [Stappia indica]MCA1298936.1 tat pathway signal sequence domain protein [Stappia indica]
MRQRTRRGVLIGAGGFVLLASLAAFTGRGWFGLGGSADTGPVFTGIIDGVAVGGYDPVSYFTDGGPRPGSPEIATSYRGASWYFANAENRDRFLADPQAYAPAYGGYCAWAVAQGNLAKGDPAYWDIVEGRLYLNYDRAVQIRWRKDIPGFIVKSEENWPGLVEWARGGADR